MWYPDDDLVFKPGAGRFIIGGDMNTMEPVRRIIFN